MVPDKSKFEMTRLRDMLDDAGIGWEDNSDELFIRTQSHEGRQMVFSAVCGVHAYGIIEVWTRSMQNDKEDPVGTLNAEEAFELIREEVGR